MNDPTMLTNDQVLQQCKHLADELDGDDITAGNMYWCWLSRGEWQLVYALSFAMEGAGLILGIHNLRDTMLCAMRYVQERGFKFRGCRATEQGRVERTRHGMVEPRNVLSLIALTRGKTPDYVTHFARAIFLVEHHYRDENLLDLLRAAEADLQATLKTIPKAPADLREAIKERGARLRELAQQRGIDLSSPDAIEALFRAEAQKLTLEEELDT